MEIDDEKYINLVIKENKNKKPKLDNSDNIVFYKYEMENFIGKAEAILEKINFQIDDHHNLPFKLFLEKEIKKNNKQAILTKILFDAQKGINSLDRLSNKIHLVKGIVNQPGIGVYPEDLTKEEFHTILIKKKKKKQ